MLMEALGFGFLISFIFYEVVGLIPGGLIVPGYLALYLHQPLRIVMTLVVALVTYLLVTFGFSRFLILYGRRRFFCMVITGFFLSYLAEEMIPHVALVGDWRIIGFLITGIIANSFLSQGVVPTLAAMGVTVVFIRLILILFIF